MKKLLQSLLTAFALFISTSLFAQDVFTGQVVDDGGTPIVGANVFAKGTQNGTKTNARGAFSLETKEATQFIVVTYVGMNTKIVPASSGDIGVITLTTKSRALSDVVVVGYGSTKKKDITSSVVSLKAKDFNQGSIVTTEQLIQGKTPGLRITTNSGEPGVGSKLRIRGGASLNGNNDPLIVIDGTPVSNAKMAGSANPLNLINPNDIESIDILKDGSATAIYGTRGTNGVILVTTKKGNRKSDKMNVSFSTNYGIQQLTNRRVDMLNAWEFRKLTGLLYDTSATKLLGNDTTNWMDQITRQARSSDNNISITGGLKGLPYRLSFGYLAQQGLLAGNGLDRYTGGINLSPSFFNNNLKFDINLKSSSVNSFFTDGGAIGAALNFDPTQGVRNGSDEAKYGGYKEWVSNGNLITIAPQNPVGLVKQISNRSNSKRMLGNMQVDYRLPIFNKALKATVNVAFDRANSFGTEKVPYTAAKYFVRGGKEQSYGESRMNKLLDMYLNYNKDIKSANSRIDATVGYSYQDILFDYPTYGDYSKDSLYGAAATPDQRQKTDLAFFGRVNYVFKNRYILNVNARKEWTSVFASGYNTALFPGVSAAWKIIDEPGLNLKREGSKLSDLKLRAGWGISGQSEIYDGSGRLVTYLPFASYSIASTTAQTNLGGVYYPGYRPDAVNEVLTYEKTRSNNIGLDYGFLSNRVYGSIDLYDRKTTNLFNFAPTPASASLSNRVMQNIGSLNNRGLEFTLNLVPIASKNITWDLGFNFTHNRNKILTMTTAGANDTSFVGINTGGIDGGVGNNIQIFKPGESINTFYTYQQVYNTAGKAVEGAYVDQNKDGVINEKDLITSTYSGEPRNLFGFVSNFRIKNASIGFVARAQSQAYAYNNIASNLGNTQSMYNSAGYLNNIQGSYFDTRFSNRQLFSDYYLEDASFFRLDNLNFGYDFGNVSKQNSSANLRASFSIQNVFIITNYTGIDPELTDGLDKNIYPRPRVYTVGLHLDF